LHLASASETLKALINVGCKIDCKNDKKQNILYSGEYRKRPLSASSYALLKDYGLDIDDRNEDDLTCLHFYCMKRPYPVEAIRELVKAGANIHSKWNRHTPWDLINTTQFDGIQLQEAVDTKEKNKHFFKSLTKGQKIGYQKLEKLLSGGDFRTKEMILRERLNSGPEEEIQLTSNNPNKD